MTPAQEHGQRRSKSSRHKPMRFRTTRASSRYLSRRDRGGLHCPASITATAALRADFCQRRSDGLPPWQHLPTDVPNGKRRVSHRYDQTVSYSAFKSPDVLRTPQLGLVRVALDCATGGRRRYAVTSIVKCVDDDLLLFGFFQNRILGASSCCTAIYRHGHGRLRAVHHDFGNDGTAAAVIRRKRAL